jgi:hypothetical protein
MTRTSYTADGGPWNGQLFALDAVDEQEIDLTDDDGVEHVYRVDINLGTLTYVGADPDSM